MLHHTVTPRPLLQLWAFSWHFHAIFTPNVTNKNEPCHGEILPGKLPNTSTMAAALALAARADQATNRTNPWTKVSLQDYTWSEVSTLEVAVCNEMHLVRTTAKQLNLELKSRPKQLLG